MTNLLLLASWGTFVVSFGLILVSLLLIGLILLQKNRGSGLSGAFGGVGGYSAFGTKTGDFLTWVTVGLTGLFLVLAVIGNFVFDKEPPKPVAATPVAPADGTQPIPGSASPIPIQQIPLTNKPPQSQAPVLPAASPTPASTPPAPVNVPTTQPG